MADYISIYERASEAAADNRSRSLDHETRRLELRRERSKQAHEEALRHLAVRRAELTVVVDEARADAKVAASDLDAILEREAGRSIRTEESIERQSTRSAHFRSEARETARARLDLLRITLAEANAQREIDRAATKEIYRERLDALRSSREVQSEIVSATLQHLGDAEKLAEARHGRALESQERQVETAQAVEEIKVATRAAKVQGVVDTVKLGVEAVKGVHSILRSTGILGGDDDDDGESPDSTFVPAESYDDVYQSNPYDY